MDKKIIDDISSSFCAAKWTQLTLDLQHGMNHSCHHPLRHKIPLKELDDNVSALHNTKYKLKQRRKMLKGSRPRECSYCWDIEDADSETISDRYIKSNDDWSKPYLDEIKNLSWDTHYNPRYLEVFFSNKCHLSCSYCMADVSSSIDEEMTKYGPYPVKDKVTRRHREYRYKKNKVELSKDTKYQNAFWQWLPTIYHDLRVLRLTGGEPLLDDNLDKLLDYMIAHEHEELTFSVNTNFCFNRTRIDQFFSKLKLLQVKSQIKVDLYTSLDTFGVQAEYIRAGLQYEQVIKNIQYYFEHFPDKRLTIMCCFNILSIPNFVSFLEEVARLKKVGNVLLDISYLKDPSYLCSKICSDKHLVLIDQSLTTMKELDFQDFEIKKLKRIFLLLKSFKAEAHGFKKEKRDFKLFIKEYDVRKKFDFEHTFGKSVDQFLL